MSRPLVDRIRDAFKHVPPPETEEELLRFPDDSPDSCDIRDRLFHATVETVSPADIKYLSGDGLTFMAPKGYVYWMQAYLLIAIRDKKGGLDETLVYEFSGRHFSPSSFECACRFTHTQIGVILESIKFFVWRWGDWDPETSEAAISFLSDFYEGDKKPFLVTEEELGPPKKLRRREQKRLLKCWAK